MNKQQMINETICNEGFSDKVLKLIDNYIIDIQNGTEDFYRYNLSEHAGLCTAGAPLIGATIIASYATASFGAGGDADGSKRCRPANWEIDERQEKYIEQWDGIEETDKQLLLKMIEEGGSDIEEAISKWDSLSEEEKQQTLRQLLEKDGDISEASQEFENAQEGEKKQTGKKV